MSEDKDEQGYDPKVVTQGSDRTDTYRKKTQDGFVNCPSCPEIKNKIDRIYVALLGDDGICLSKGLVKEITDLKTRFGFLEATIKAQRNTNASWLSWIKPVFGGVTVVAVTELIIFLVSHHL